ncbi:MAG: hypothetical protein AAF921_09695 [Cyanobacteria bacterium P01_D01_bin.44]
MSQKYLIDSTQFVGAREDEIIIPKDFLQRCRLLEDRIGNNLQSLALMQELVTQINQDYQTLVKLIDVFATQQIQPPNEHL